MKPDVTINGVSMLSLGWLRETVNFPTPQSQSNTITVPGRNSPIRFTEALGRVAYQPRSFDIYKFENRKGIWQKTEIFISKNKWVIFVSVFFKNFCSNHIYIYPQSSILVNV